MSVRADLSLEAVREELPAVTAYVVAAGLALDTTTLTEADLCFFVTFCNAVGDQFIAEFDCRDYAMYPPTVEFVDVAHTNRAVPALYPAGFHGMPCVCARYNRKAYSERGGPHGDWRLIDWQLPTGNGAAVETLAMIISDLHGKIAQSTGRLG